MIAIVKELKDLMKANNLSTEKASHFLGCANNSVRRWVENTNPPTQSSIVTIKAGIRKIKEAFPDEYSIYDLSMKARSLWRKIKGKATKEEKLNVLEINEAEGPAAYIKALELLVEKYRPSTKQIQMFK